MKFWSILLPLRKKVQYKKRGELTENRKRERTETLCLPQLGTVMGPCQVDFLFSIKYEKPRCFVFFSPKFSNCATYFSAKNL